MLVFSSPTTADVVAAAAVASVLLPFDVQDQGSALPGAIRGSRPPRDEVPATGSVRMELLERLFRIGEKDPSALARVLEEEDPLQVRGESARGAMPRAKARRALLR